MVVVRPFLRRDGPPVIDVERALRRAARLGLFVDQPWRDAFDGTF